MRTAITVERTGRAATVRFKGDLIVPSARSLYGSLRAVAKRRDVKQVILDFSEAGRIDSAGIAIVSLVGKQLAKHGKQLELRELQERHRAAFAFDPEQEVAPVVVADEPGVLERIGDRVYLVAHSTRELWRLFAETLRQGLAVVTRRRRLREGAISDQIARMGVDAVFIVGLLSFLLGMTTAFQGATQLDRFGAGVFVADMISLSMVRELAPLITAIILTGRTGAAIAAELGTMKVRSEVDALTVMGINPVRFLVLPRLAAITVVVPALTLMAMFIGMLGGMVVAAALLDMTPVAFWTRVVERIDLWDYAHGLSKSFVFAWVIGLAGCHLGMRAGSDASSVGSATTRTVVTSIFFIIIVDAIFATVSTFTRYG